MCQQQARVRFPASVWCSWTSWLLSCSRAVKWYFWVSEHSCRDTVRRRRCCLTRETSRHVAYVSACVRCVCVSVRRCESVQMGRAQPQDPENEWAYRGSILSHTPVLWPGRLWFPWSEAALIYSSNGQKSRRVGSADQSNGSREAERAPVNR